MQFPFRVAKVYPMNYMNSTDKYYVTVVLEYPTVEAAPRIGPDTKDFQHDRVVSLQFSDALKELEQFHFERTIEPSI